MADPGRVAIRILIVGMILVGILVIGFCVAGRGATPVAATACGVPYDIQGRAGRDIGGSLTVGVYQARVRLYHNDEGRPGELVATALTNPFGHYRFQEVTPCIPYLVTIEHKWYPFQVPEVPVDGNGSENPVVVNFEVGEPGK